VLTGARFPLAVSTRLVETGLKALED